MKESENIYTENDIHGLVTKMVDDAIEMRCMVMKYMEFELFPDIIILFSGHLLRCFGDVVEIDENTTRVTMHYEWLSKLQTEFPDLDFEGSSCYGLMAERFLIELAKKYGLDSFGFGEDDKLQICVNLWGK